MMDLQEALGRIRAAGSGHLAEALAERLAADTGLALSEIWDLLHEEETT